MMLTDDIELLDGLPIAHVRSLKLIAAADMHLGYEGAMAKSGVFLPKVNLKHITEMLGKAIRKTGAKELMVVGDIKNTYSDVITDELNELADLADFLKEKGVSLSLIKTPHDNFVERYGSRLGLKAYRGQARLGDYLFFHGERKPDVGDARFLIMGHEHPAIGITGNSGRRERLRCFLYGRLGRAQLLVMPAMGYFSTGTELNAPGGRILSPVLRSAGVGRMHAIAVGYGSTMDFGTVSELRGA